MSPHTPAGQTRERIYRFMRERLLSGAPPTVREVQQAFGFRAVQSAREHLEALVGQGLLDKQAGRARGYRLPQGQGGDLPTRLVPLLGQVQAGDLTTAVEDPQGYLPIQSRLAEEDLFALRVRGDSMVGAGILDGDIAIVKRQPSADSGDIVVALVNGEATVKRFKRRGKEVELHPENPAFEPIVPPTEELRVLGKVVEVRRYLEGARLLESALP
ncbi:MAG: transcriptional repressor LexA [Candidatus Binatia bacterium]